MGEEVGWDPLFELIFAPRTLRILHETDGEPRSVKELSDACDASRPTLYRQVNELIERDLLREETEIDENGNHHTVYRNNIKQADITVRPRTEEVRVDLTLKDTATEFKRLWEDMKHES